MSDRGDLTPRSAQALDGFLSDLLSHHAEESVAFRRRLHMHPELSQQEFETTRTIASRLDVARLPTRVMPSRVGLTCDVAADAEGPLIAVRADIDALPLPDAKNVSYASTVAGVTHACGHDAHTTIVLGAGIALDALRRAGEQNRDLPRVGPVRLIFQSSEEKAPGGARQIIDAGGLDGVAAILGLHCDPSLPVGTVGLRSGAITSAVDLVEIVLRGPGGHTARPHQTVNLLHDVGRVLVDLPDQVIADLPSPEGHARLVFGVVEAGHAPNVIPSEARLCGTFRTLHREVWEQAPAVIRRRLTSLFDDERLTVDLRQPSLGGEDFSFYLEHVPGSYLRLGVAPPDVAEPAALHTSLFDIDEGALAVGIRLMVHAVLRAQRELAG
jgi:amidohydrolase